MRETSSTTWGPERIARWSGVAGFILPALTIVALPIWSYPGTGASAGTVAQWAATHHDRLIVSMLLNTVGVTVLLVFVVAVWTMLRQRLPEGSILPGLFGTGFAGCVLLLLGGFTAADLLFYRDHDAKDARLLYDLTFGLLAMSGMPIVVAAVAFAVAVYAHRMLPLYTAHLAVGVAITHPLLLLAFIVHDGPLSLEGLSITLMPAFLFAWIVGTALAMPRNSGRA